MDKGSSCGSIVECTCVSFYRFLKHFEAGSVGCELVARQHIAALTDDLFDEGCFDAGEEVSGYNGG